MLWCTIIILIVILSITSKFIGKSDKSKVSDINEVRYVSLSPDEEWDKYWHESKDIRVPFM